MKPFQKIVIIATSILLNCSKNQVSPVDESCFTIHFLKDTILTIDDIKGQDLFTLELDSIPWLSASDINFYDFSTHCIYLKESKKDFFPGSSSPFELPERFWLKPFIVVAYNKPCYVGHFYPSVFTKWPDGIYITDDYYINDYADDILHISNSGYNVCGSTNNIDIRDSLTIKNALIDDNIFRAGIEIDIDTIRIIDNSDTATVQYTFTITNNDQDNLYVLDPNLMEPELFLFINHGIVFWSEQTGFLSSNNYIKQITPNPLDNWQPVWFTKIESKKFITRTISFKGYPTIQPGQYCCYLKFTSPLNVEKDKRTMLDGRYWIGEILSNTVNISVED